MRRYAIVGLVLWCMVTANWSARAQTTTSGTPLATVQDVTAFSNGPDTGTGRGDLAYQCVALVNRWAQTVDGIHLPRVGTADKLFPAIQGGAVPNLMAIDNGGITPPHIGDIVCFSGGAYGHVGIIASEVGDIHGFIRVFEQNWPPSSTALHDIPIDTAGYRYLIKPRSGKTVSYVCQGWCHYVESGGAAPIRYAICLVLDRTGSMAWADNAGSGGTKFADMVRGVQSLVATADDSVGIGVVAFNTTATLVSPLARAAKLRSLLGDQLVSLKPAGDTDIGAGLTMAVDQVLVGQPKPSVILLSDGVNNVGSWAPLVARCATQKIPVSTIAFGAEIDTPHGRDADRRALGDIAFATGGMFFTAMPSNVASVYNRLLAWSTGQSTMLATTTDVKAGASFSYPFAVDGAATRTSAFVDWTGVGTVTASLKKPDGTTVPARAIGTNALMITTDHPAGGKYELVGRLAGGANALVNAAVTLAGGDVVGGLGAIRRRYEPGTAVPFVFYARGTNLPSEINAKVTRRRPLDTQEGIGGLIVSALSSRTQTGHVTLYDDGNHGDGAAGDGIYAGALETNSTLVTGPYALEVKLPVAVDAAGRSIERTWRQTFVIGNKAGDSDLKAILSVLK